MAYIGREPTVGNFQVCDAISVVNGQAAYTMQVSSTNVSPETANHVLCSLNGVLQKPGSSFTVSGSTITFASNLATGDVIDFIQILGSTLDLGVPSNDTVGAAQIKDDLISGTTALASEPADTDEFLVSDAGTLKRIDYSLIKSSTTHTLLASATASDSATIAFTSNIDSTYKNYLITFENVSPATDDVTLYFDMYVSGSVKNSSNCYDYACNGLRGNGTKSDTASEGANDIKVSGMSFGNATGENGFGYVYLINPSETADFKLMRAFTAHIDNGARACVDDCAGFLNDGQAAVDGVRFLFSSGNISTGTFRLYGVT